MGQTDKRTDGQASMHRVLQEGPILIYSCSAVD